MNYYKITNEEETHNDLTYKTGLNVDPLPFNPSGDCEPGGIYFAREDILAFLSYGPWIREVTLPPDAQVYANPGMPKKWKADRVILGKRIKITVKVIKELIVEGADVHADNDLALRLASEHGHLALVKVLLLAGADVHADNDLALRLASEHGHLEVVKVLLEAGANVHADSDWALRWASENGHVEICDLLLAYGANPDAISYED